MEKGADHKQEAVYGKGKDDVMILMGDAVRSKKLHVRSIGNTKLSIGVSVKQDASLSLCGLVMY